VQSIQCHGVGGYNNGLFSCWSVLTAMVLSSSGGSWNVGYASSIRPVQLIPEVFVRSSLYPAVNSIVAKVRLTSDSKECDQHEECLRCRLALLSCCDTRSFILSL